MGLGLGLEGQLGHVRRGDGARIPRHDRLRCVGRLLVMVGVGVRTRARDRVRARGRGMVRARGRGVVRGMVRARGRGRGRLGVGGGVRARACSGNSQSFLWSPLSLHVHSEVGHSGGWAFQLATSQLLTHHASLLSIWPWTAAHVFGSPPGWMACGMACTAPHVHRSVVHSSSEPGSAQLVTHLVRVRVRGL